MDRPQEQRLLSLVLDGLDDLYDQRFGAPAGRRELDQRAEVWLVRLLIIADVALHGSAWDGRLMGVASEVSALVQSGLSGTELGDAALAATDDLRKAIAASLE